MLFRYEFSQKLDLSIFRKQAAHYISNFRELTYHLVLNDFRIEIEIATPDSTNAHLVSMHIADLVRDEDGEIIRATAVFPKSDLRFKEIPEIAEAFPIDHYKASFESNSVSYTVDKICFIAKLLFKINNLKAFL